MLKPVDPILFKSSLVHSNVCCLFCSRAPPAPKKLPIVTALNLVMSCAVET